MLRNRLVRTSAGLVALVVLLAACRLGDNLGQPTASGRAPHSVFCRTLGRINAGIDTIPAQPAYDFMAAVATRLADADAPDSLKPDLEQFAATLGGITAAAKAGQPIGLALYALMQPSLVEVEHRLALGIGDECGVLLSDPSTWPPTPSESSVGTGDEARSICAGWPQQTNALLNNRFPYTIDTSGANYWGFRYAVEPGGWIELHGHYPHARYFSILPNDEDTNNLHQLTDVNIDPDADSVNPWRTSATTTGDNAYTVRVVFTAPPVDPAPNTSYVGLKADGTTPSAGGTVVYRIYGSDAGNQPNSAGVPLPAVTIHAADGSVEASYPECDPYPDGPPNIDPKDVPSMPPLPFISQFTPRTPTLSASSTYDVPFDLFSNPDVQYLSLFFARRYGNVVVVRGKAITTPDTRAGAPPNYTGYDGQGWTMCSYNVAAGIANTCLLDHELPVDRNGYYTAVVSTAADRPTNAITAKGVSWLDWGPYLDNQVSFRLFPRDTDIARAIAADASSGTHTSPYTPQAVYCAKRTFERGGARACFESDGT